MKRFLPSRRRCDEAGAAAVLVALFFAFVALPLGAASVDLARLYVELQRVQAAADAAATAGVTFMPDDLPKAKARALEIAADNGYDDASADVTVAVTVGAKPTQLRVTVSSTVNNSFARSFGVPRSTVSRTAVADFNGPAPMGSPCNTYGNEPVGGSNRGTPAGTKLNKPPLADCDSNPEFWSNIAGPNWPKGNGDQFMTRTCSGTVDGCTGTRNNEFDPRGYFYIIRILPGAVGKTVRIELYDPAFVEVGDYCERGPSGGAVNNNAWNMYTRTDGMDRYKIQGSGATNSWCTGDVMAGSVPTVTSFGLRQPTITNDPRQAPPDRGCVKQYPGYALSSVTSNSIKGSGTNRDGASPNQDLTKVFRQWVPFCSFTPSAAGDYYLQVRTNVRLNTSVSDNEGGYSGNQAVFDQAGDDTTVGGDGANRYAIRAYADGATPGSISVSAYERMPIYANAAGAETTFNLVRIVPAAATKTLVFTFFDVGEGAVGGTMTVVPPTDSNMGGSISGCTGAGKVNGDLSNCQITNISSAAGWNGRSQTINVPIPGNYDCTVTDPGGCWFRVEVSFGGTNPVNDSTTWTASVDGQPVRLIE